MMIFFCLLLLKTWNSPAGLMVGKALYEGILINVALAPFFVTRLQGRTPTLDDLATLDPGLHKSLVQAGGES